MRMGAFPLILVSAMLGMLSGPPSASGQPADPETKIPVFLSTDVGNEMDDQWAVVYTLLSPEFDVLGVASAYAPRSRRLLALWDISFCWISWKTAWI